MLQTDAASGDRNPHDGRLETFNPLFPNGYYFVLASYTCYGPMDHLIRRFGRDVVPSSIAEALAG